MFGSDSSMNFLRNIPRILFIKNILDWQKQVICLLYTVDIIRNRNKSHVPLGKIPLKIPSGLDIVTSKTGQILYNHTIHFSGFHIVKHPAKGGTVKIRPRKTVVNIGIIYRQVFFSLDIICNQLSLIANTVAFCFVAIFSGKPDIYRSPKNLHDVFTSASICVRIRRLISSDTSTFSRNSLSIL